MTVRGVLALLTMFVMSHLFLVGPDNACADHGRNAAAGQAHGRAGHERAADVMPDGMPHGASHQPCETPSSTHCCDAVTSCAASLAIIERDELQKLSFEGRAIPLHPAGALISRSLAPEPPPPKA